MELTILRSGAKPKRVVMVDLKRPNGEKIYMSGSVGTVAAQCYSAGHDVEVLDFNLDKWEDDRTHRLFTRAQAVGISVVGAPDFPETIRFSQQISQHFPKSQIILGGQVIKRLDTYEFRRIFGKRAVQGTSQANIEPVLGALPSAFEVSLIPVWERMGDQRLKQYLEREFSLVLSQGCIYDCLYCFADKDRPEEHKRLDLFTADLLYLLKKAKEFGLTYLQCYASALDLFQNPEAVAHYLQVMADLSEHTGVKLRVRGLTCTKSFILASRAIPNFAELVRRSGLWCVGFGIDGPDKKVWREQNKLQNNAEDIQKCLQLTEQLGMRAEVLMIMGYPNNTPKQLWKTVKVCYQYIQHYDHTMLRPYLAKTVVPGNLGWEIEPSIIEKLIADPRKFYNLDICAFGSPVTHPQTVQRWLANASFAAVLATTALGRCSTSPLLPQGQRGLYGWTARHVNHLIPQDR